MPHIPNILPSSLNENNKKHGVYAKSDVKDCLTSHAIQLSIHCKVWPCRSTVT